MYKLWVNDSCRPVTRDLWLIAPSLDVAMDMWHTYHPYIERVVVGGTFGEAFAEWVSKVSPNVYIEGRANDTFNSIAP